MSKHSYADCCPCDSCAAFRMRDEIVTFTDETIAETAAARQRARACVDSAEVREIGGRYCVMLDTEGERRFLRHKEHRT